MKINNFDNPIFIFLFCCFAMVANLISSIYFFPLLLLGILYMAFHVSLKNRYYYSLIFVVITVLFLESNNGFKPLSIILLMSFTHVFVTPYIKRTLSFTTLNSYIYIAVFYLGILFLWSINNEIETNLYITIISNIIIDFIIFGLFI